MFRSAGAVNCLCKNPNANIGRVVPLMAVLLGAWALTPAASQAQTLQEEELEGQGLAEQPTTSNWNVTLGAGIAARPVYQGASAYRVRPIPLFSASYGNLVFLDARGLGINAINWNGLRAGPILGFEGGRSESDDTRLNGLGDISSSLTGGAFAAYHFGPFEISATVRQAITHTGNGLAGLVWFNYRHPIIPDKLDLIAGPDLEFADGQYARTWFGVSQTQSAQSGLPVYTPGAGVKDVGLHLSLTYHYSEHFLLRGFAGIKELTSDVANSPIVQSKTQGLIGLGVAYHF
jgi:outer membrane scaffolding protein for murein synthesis (MipA/OmpV family)